MFPFEHIVSVSKSGSLPVYRQIAFSIIRLIRNGTLKPGTPLPGSRDLARILSVHRKTVIAAYDELQTQDWITIIPRKHVVVSHSIPLLKSVDGNIPAVERPYENVFRLPFRQIEKDLPALSFPAVPDVIIDDGHPDVRLSPIDELLKTYRLYTARRPAIKNAHIGTERGTAQLREVLVAFLAGTRGLNISAENLLITHGAQMSIYLAAQLLLSPKSKVIVAKPNYPVASKTFEESGATLIEVPTDEDGIDTDAIEAICRREKIDSVYVIPHHHYPTTVTLSVARRMKLLELSKQYSFSVIEDDYDYDYHYDSSPYLPLASSHHNGSVIYIGSFSKVLDPSLRIGFMVAPENFINQAVALRKLIDVGGDGYMQNALATLIQQGELKRHLKKARKVYHSRRDFLDRMLKQKLGEAVSYVLPSGGMAIWLKLLPRYPVDRLSRSRELMILRTDIDQNAFRFGFASMNEKELEASVDALSRQLELIEVCPTRESQM